LATVEGRSLFKSFCYYSELIPSGFPILSFSLFASSKLSLKNFNAELAAFMCLMDFPENFIGLALRELHQLNFWVKHQKD
jgi:hypothetical protein